MLLEAIYHRPKQNWAYGYDKETVHIRIRTKRDDIREINVLYGDKCLPFEKMQAAAMKVFTSDELFDYWEAAVKPPFRRLCYGFQLQADGKEIWYTDLGFAQHAPKVHLGLFEYPFLNPIDLLQTPSWVKDAVFYQIFPERFANGDPSNDPEGVLPWGDKPEIDNFFGGDLQGVMDRLDHLEKLGITAIYFTPIFEAPANHKYDTGDYLRVDPHFGSIEKLKELVRACHDRGIRVVLDAVFNHCGKTFPIFVDVMEKGSDSIYADWFHVRKFPLGVESGIPTYDTFAFEPHMPKFNTEHPDVKAYLLNVAQYWIKEVGIDGWRLDVANEVDHAFWREFRALVKQANPDAYILGEVWHDAIMWLQGDQFDGVMNYPLAGAVLDFFVFGHDDAYTFANRVGALLARYPQQAVEACLNHLGSHDTVRLLTLCKNDKRVMKQAVLFQFLHSGPPCIYYGDEIGMNGEFDPDNRKCMEWDETKQDLDLFCFYQKLIILRKEHPALRTGTLRFLEAAVNDSLLVYERSSGESRLIIVLNRQEQERSVTVRLDSGIWQDALSGDTAPMQDGMYTEILPPYGCRVWVRS